MLPAGTTVPCPTIPCPTFPRPGPRTHQPSSPLQTSWSGQSSSSSKLNQSLTKYDGITPPERHNTVSDHRSSSRPSDLISERAKQCCAWPIPTPLRRFGVTGYYYHLRVANRPRSMLAQQRCDILPRSHDTGECDVFPLPRLTSAVFPSWGATVLQPAGPGIPCHSGDSCIPGWRLPCPTGRYNPGRDGKTLVSWRSLPGAGRSRGHFPFNPEQRVLHFSHLHVWSLLVDWPRTSWGLRGKVAMPECFQQSKPAWARQKMKTCIARRGFR